ncbi:DNA-binding transcriptional MocR family regulator [Streptacidiphilus sp. EB103A]
MAPEGVVVCSGVAQTLTLLVRVLRARGHRAIALEDPGSLPQYPLLTAAVPGVRVSGIAAGLHLIAVFPFPVPEAVCAAAGVRLRPLGDYCAATAAAPAADVAPTRFVLGYAHLTPSEIQHAFGRLAESLRSVAV